VIAIGTRKRVMLAVSAALLVGSALAAGCSRQAVPAQIIEDISPQDAFTLIQENQNNPDFAIIDVRTPEEFAEGHLENATNIDFYSQTFRDKINQQDKDKTYLIYCRSGKRSASALEIMAELGFREAYNLLGGIIDWQAAGLPFTK